MTNKKGGVFSEKQIMKVDSFRMTKKYSIERTKPTANFF
jgi:hypothetical protein